MRENNKNKKDENFQNTILQIYNGNNGPNTSKKYYVIKTSVEYILITIGAFIMSIGVSLILLPNELSTGGFSGIASIFYYFFNIQVGKIIIALNTPLLILVYIKLGRNFFIKNVYGIIALSLFIDLLDTLNPITDDKFLACIFGGILSGMGTALVLKGNGSTGGSDLVSSLLKVYKPQIRTSKAILIFDFIVVLINVLFFNKIDVGLYSAIAIYIMGKMIDIIFEGTDFAKVLFIISPEYKNIAVKIGEEINRGSTGLYARGMYTNDNKMMLLCVGSRNEAYKMQKIAKEIDKSSFIVIIDAIEVIGKGFK